MPVWWPAFEEESKDIGESREGAGLPSVADDDRNELHYYAAPVIQAILTEIPNVEVTDEMGVEWAGVPAYAEYADRVLGPGGSDRLLQEFKASSALMQQHARGLFERWCHLAEGAAIQVPAQHISAVQQVVWVRWQKPWPTHSTSRKQSPNRALTNWMTPGTLRKFSVRLSRPGSGNSDRHRRKIDGSAPRNR